MGYNDYDGFDDGDDADESENQGPKALRDAQKAAAKRNKELETQLAKLTSQLAERNLKDVLESKSLRPGLAKTIAKEGVDATDPAAIEAWLSDTANQEDFAFSLAGDDSPADSDDDEADGHGELAAAQSRMQGASQGALPDDRIQQARGEIHAAKSMTDIQAALDRAIKSTN